MKKLIGAMIMVASIQQLAAQQNVPLHELTATEIAARTHSGEVATRELVAILLRRVGERAELGAFISIDRRGARAAARQTEADARRGRMLGALAGVPIVVKDNVNVRGLVTTAGTPALESFVPERSAPVVDRLMAAGAIVLGKTNMHELAFGVTSNNARFGAVRNPYDLDYFAGGSSGGTAAAIAARLAPAGLGTDTGGSVRIPAALNGIAGLRPTIGRYPQAGMVPISVSRDTAGPMARTVADLILLDNVITGYDQRIDAYSLEGLRLGLPRSPFWSQLDPGTSKLAEDLLVRLVAAGAILVEIDMSALGELMPRVEAATALYEARRDLARFLDEHETEVTLAELAGSIASPDVKAIFETAILGDQAVSATTYRDAMQTHRPALQALYRRVFSEYRIEGLIFPTTRLPARTLEESDTLLIDGTEVSTFAAFVANTAPGSVAGIPGITVPIGVTGDGLPVGIALDGPTFSDRRLLAIGLAIEGLVDPMPAPE